MGDTRTTGRDVGPAVGRHLSYGLGLLPAAAGELVAVAVSGPAGGVDAARRHLACRGTPWSGAARVGGGRVVAHGLLGVLLGVAWWWLAWMAVVAVARGVLVTVLVVCAAVAVVAAWVQQI